MTKPYALICPYSPLPSPNNIDKKYTAFECFKRLRIHLQAQGLNPDDFRYFQFDHIPYWLQDSYASQFIGEFIIMTVAERLID